MALRPQSSRRYHLCYSLRSRNHSPHLEDGQNANLVLPPIRYRRSLCVPLPNLNVSPPISGTNTTSSPTVEEIGYIARAAAFNSTGLLLPYILQAIFLLLPPILFAASLYMVYTRIIRAVQGERFSLTPQRWTTTLFVLGDIACLNVQSTGAGLLVNPKIALIGEYIIVAGLGLQVLMFAGFLLCCIVFNIRFRAYVAETGAASEVPWQSCLNMLYSTSTAILVRNIYRVVEFIMGQDAYLFNNEWPTYVFDASLMLLVMIGFFIWYPSQLRPRTWDSTMELTTDGAEPAEPSRGTKG